MQGLLVFIAFPRRFLFTILPPMPLPPPISRVLADAMLGLLLFVAGGPLRVLRGRVQRTAGFGGQLPSRSQSVLSHTQLHRADVVSEASGAGEEGLRGLRGGRGQGRVV